MTDILGTALWVTLAISVMVMGAQMVGGLMDSGIQSAASNLQAAINPDAPL